MNKNIYKLTFDPEKKLWSRSAPMDGRDGLDAMLDSPDCATDETVEFFDLYSDEEADRIVNRRNHDLETGFCETHVCKDCGKIFFINVKEKEWYERREFKLPKRCRHCRIERKNKKERQ